MLKRLLLKISALSHKAARKIDRKNRDWYRLLSDWKKREREDRPRTNYPELGPDSIVFDLGGYWGQWASDIQAQYTSRVLVFEPLPSFAERITKRFQLNESIEVYPFGLGPRDEQIELGEAADATSAFVNKGKTVSGELRDIQAFLKEQGIDQIDLMKINIEGGEYELLEYLIATGIVQKVKNIQVQFHHFMPNAKERMERIQQNLHATHELTYQFTFLWENWRIR